MAIDLLLNNKPENFSDQIGPTCKEEKIDLNNCSQVFALLRMERYQSKFIEEEMEPADILILSPEEQEQLIPKKGPRVRLIDFLCREHCRDNRVRHFVSRGNQLQTPSQSEHTENTETANRPDPDLRAKENHPISTADCPTLKENEKERFSGEETAEIVKPRADDNSVPEKTDPEDHKSKFEKMCETKDELDRLSDKGNMTTVRAEYPKLSKKAEEEEKTTKETDKEKLKVILAEEFKKFTLGQESQAPKQMMAYLAKYVTPSLENSGELPLRLKCGEEPDQETLLRLEEEELRRSLTPVEGEVLFSREKSAEGGESCAQEKKCERKEDTPKAFVGEVIFFKQEEKFGFIRFISEKESSKTCPQFTCSEDIYLHASTLLFDTGSAQKGTRVTFNLRVAGPAEVELLRDYRAKEEEIRLNNSPSAEQRQQGNSENGSRRKVISEDDSRDAAANDEEATKSSKPETSTQDKEKNDFRDGVILESDSAFLPELFQELLDRRNINRETGEKGEKGPAVVSRKTHLIAIGVRKKEKGNSAEERLKGTVIWFNGDYGYIAQHGGAEVYFQSSSLSPGSSDALRKDAAVSFLLSERPGGGKRRMVALDVKPDQKQNHGLGSTSVHINHRKEKKTKKQQDSFVNWAYSSAKFI